MNGKAIIVGCFLGYACIGLSISDVLFTVTVVLLAIMALAKGLQLK